MRRNLPLLCLAVVWLACAEPPYPASDVHAFIGASVFDGDGDDLIEDAVLLVRDGRIVALGPAGAVDAPPGAEVTDLSGRYVIPGMISTHVHVSAVHGLREPAYTPENTRRQLDVFARYGVTTVLSLGGEKAPAFTARDTQDTAALDRARIFVSGDVITADTPEEARRRVDEVAELDPDFIKIRVDDNLGTSQKMPPEAVRAVIDEANDHGLPVAVHIFYLADAKFVLEAGAELIAHSVRDRELDHEFIARMKARDVAYCPTLTRELSTFVYANTPDFFDDPFFLREADTAVIRRLTDPKRQAALRESPSARAYEKALPVALRNVKHAADAGVRVVLGTDAGPFPERFQGYFEHLELEMMADAGLSPLQILRAATSDAAHVLGLDDVGTLEPGAWADFVVLEQNPLDDIRHTRTITHVFIAGNAVEGAGR